MAEDKKKMEALEKVLDLDNASETELLDALDAIRAKDRSNLLAETLLSQHGRMREAKVQQQRSLDERNRVYYYRCGRCSRPAIFLRGDPGTAIIRPQDWCASYKRYLDDWTHDFVLCQACAADGTETKIVVTWPPQGGGFQCVGNYRRFICWMHTNPGGLTNQKADPIVANQTALPAEPAMAKGGKS